MRVAADRVEGNLLWFTCPQCGGYIKEPFSRISGPVAISHRHSHPSCRLVVSPDPIGSEHEIVVVGQRESYETVLARLLSHPGRVRDLIRANAVLSCEILPAADGTAGG